MKKALSHFNTSMLRATDRPIKDLTKSHSVNSKNALSSRERNCNLHAMSLLLK